ncbi:MAG TPA: GlsB/YeaQ/YmgE family stress response membrane protein [Mycobacteriales bacterium]|nr:GlsB/YeaQ/YmgE family stress response membrane protein [Mycobacteriales bacterium]
MIVLGIFLAIVLLFVILGAIGAALWWVISTAVLGLVFGALGRLLVPGKQSLGILATIVCGWVGSLIGGGIGLALWGHNHHEAFTFLIELGVSAAAVAIWSANSRRSVGSGRSRGVIDV